MRRRVSSNNLAVISRARWALPFLLGALALGCGRSIGLDESGGAGGATSTSASHGSQTGAGGQGQGPPVVTVLTPNQKPLPGQSECKVTITDNVAFEGHTHLDVCTPITYHSNPPSSGDHWPIWAMFRTYATHVPWEMLVHDLEHGAIVMSYACGAPCPDVTAAFEQAASDFGPDPLCITSSGDGTRSRIVIQPDPKLPAPIALSAWEATYVATCIDPPSLLAFIKAHYDHATERLCADGRDPSDPSTGVPSCPGL